MAQKINIVIDQGATFSTSFNLKDENGDPLNLSAYTGYSQVRRHYTSVQSYNFDVALSNTGVVTLSMADTVTSTILPGRYVYDIKIVDQANTISRVIEGIVTVTPCVTR